MKKTFKKYIPIIFGLALLVGLATAAFPDDKPAAAPAMGGSTTAAPAPAAATAPAAAPAASEPQGDPSGVRYRRRGGCGRCDGCRRLPPMR